MKNLDTQNIKKILKTKNIKFQSISFLAGDASDRKYYEIDIDCHKYVLMHDCDHKSLKNFIKISNSISNFVSTPQIIFNIEDNSVLILENFGKDKFNNILDKKNRNKLYLLATDALIYIHKQKIKFNIGFYDESKFTYESNLFFDWFVNQDSLSKENLKNEFNFQFRDFLKELQSIPEVFVHRDYHVDNLFFLKNKNEHFRCGWIDYQDAVIGPCVYDLVSLTQDARLDVDKRIEKNVINHYLRHFKEIDVNKFFLCYKIVAIQRHLKVIGIFKRLAIRDKKNNYLKHIPRVINMLRNNLNDRIFKNISDIICPLLKND